MDLNKDDNKVSGVVYVNENYKYMLQVKDLRREPCWNFDEKATAMTLCRQSLNNIFVFATRLDISIENE